MAINTSSSKPNRLTGESVPAQAPPEGMVRLSSTSAVHSPGAALLGLPTTNLPPALWIEHDVENIRHQIYHNGHREQHG
jgi:hypothetical protein